MMIINEVNIPSIVTNKALGVYLVKHGIPLLQRNGNEMTFSKNKKTEEALSNLPFSIRLIGRVVNSS